MDDGDPIPIGIQPPESYDNKQIPLNVSPILDIKEENEQRIQDLVEKHWIIGSCTEARRRSHAQSFQDIGAIRQQEKQGKEPPVTPEEYLLGIRKEELEPEVRDCVLSVLRKGYNPYSSGFDMVAGNNGLHAILFISRDGERPTENTLRKIWGLSKETGILTMAYVTKDNTDTGTHWFGEANGPYCQWAISFVETSGDPEKIKQHWHTIDQALPDLGKPAMIMHTAYTGAPGNLRTLVRNVPEMLIQHSKT